MGRKGLLPAFVLVGLWRGSLRFALRSKRRLVEVIFLEPTTPSLQIIR
jgi:hypothetical protein